MPRQIDPDELCDWLLARPEDRRTMLAVAGAPGSGKSTLAATLVARLNDSSPGIAALLPMDGYHFDDAVLKSLGRLHRKGAPDTFDVGGLIQMIGRLARNEEDDIAVPVFDRGIEISRAGARLIPRLARIIVVEGNYLLLSEPPWNGLARLFDATVLLDVPQDVLRQRLTRRWMDLGLPEDEIRRKVEENDLPNGLAVVNASASPDFIIRT